MGPLHDHRHHPAGDGYGPGDQERQGQREASTSLRR
jgi:hypothetical protein